MATSLISKSRESVEVSLGDRAAWNPSAQRGSAVQVEDIFATSRDERTPVWGVRRLIASVGDAAPRRHPADDPPVNAETPNVHEQEREEDEAVDDRGADVGGRARHVGSPESLGDGPHEQSLRESDRVGDAPRKARDQGAGEGGPVVASQACARWGFNCSAKFCYPALARSYELFGNCGGGVLAASMTDLPSGNYIRRALR